MLQVNGDGANHLHSPSIPEYTFDVLARPAQVFESTYVLPGCGGVGLHDLHCTTTDLQVRL